MALTKVTKTGITDNAIDADKIEDGTVLSADIAPGTIENAKLANSSITVNGSSVSLGGSVTAKHIDWQAVKTADFNAVAGEGYFVDTDSVGAVTATLPGSPSAGDTIAFKDYAANFGTNALTIARNGNNIQGLANDSEISTNRASIVLVYIDATKGWLYTNESNVTNFSEPAYVTATGGTVTTSGDYKIHTFTGDGCFVVSCAGAVYCGVPGGSTEVSYLVIAGGGGGTWDRGEGGGAGGYREGQTPQDCYSASPLATTGLPVSATTYPITVGGGGVAGSSPSQFNGGNGSDSIFSTITSTGGHGGAASPVRGGGSGAGAHGGSPGNIGTGNTPPVSPPQGNNGGDVLVGPTTGYLNAGGGGGAFSAGTNAGVPGGGPGGSGATSSINGSPTTRAGGGGGSRAFDANPNGSGSSGTGGSGGGGAAAPAQNTNGTAGTANTGGGGGGAANNPSPGSVAGAGGKGIVILRYKYQN
jgi:hypothetical protein